MKGNNQRALLIEIMIAVLFFALCAAVILETFVSAHNLSRRAEANTAVLAHMQDMAEQLYAAEDHAELIMQAGYAPEGEGWRCEIGDCVIELRMTEEQTEVGMLRRFILTALRDGECIAEIPSVRYIPGEVAA